MTHLQPSSKPFAVVTGASSGIGLELARQFVEHEFDVMMVAEDDELGNAAAKIGGEPFQVDLSQHTGVERLWSAIQASGRPLDALAVNAGVGNAGPFIETRLDADLAVIALNVTSTVHLAKRALPAMVAAGRGRVLFTASIASLMPGPYYATYAASKSFVLSFAEAVRHELRGTGVTVTALIPGPTDTNFFRRAGMQGSRADEGHKDDPADVARDGFEALMAGDGKVIAGSARNKLQAAMATVMPDKATAAMQGRLAKPGVR